MSPARITTLVNLELRQRLRNVAWYVLLGIFAVLLLGMTALSLAVFGDLQESGSWMYSIIVYFVLLLALLVSPTLSGNSGRSGQAASGRRRRKSKTSSETSGGSGRRLPSSKASKKCSARL